MQLVYNAKYLIVVSLVMVWLSSCNVTRKLPEDSYLLTKNSVKIEYPDSLPKGDRVLPIDLKAFIPYSQTPTSRFFGSDLQLWLYNLSDTAKNNWGNRLLRRMGKPPVIFDSTSMVKSTREMGMYMSARGFYDSSVGDSVVFKKKRAYVSYSANSNSPFKISKVTYNFQDKSLEPLILEDTVSSLIKVGYPLDRMEMEKERSRIASMLENVGYYQFSVNNISYLVDTLESDHKASVQINISKRISGNSYVDNQIYRIRNIYVNPDYQPYIADSMALKRQVDTLQYKGVDFIYSGGDINVRPEILAYSLSIYPGTTYDKKELEYTSARISNLKLFKNVNILFNDVSGDSLSSVTYIGAKDSMVTTYEGSIDCSILCTPSMRQSYKVDAEASTTSNYTGLSLTLGYANKNIFKGAEVFDASVKTAYQFMHYQGSKDSYEFGGTLGLSFVRLLTPFGIGRYSRATNTLTRFEVSANTQRRPDYDRTISSFNFGYQWSRTSNLKFNFRPISFSLIKVPWIDEDYLESITNPYLQSSYSSQMILGVSGDLSYSTLNRGLDNSFSIRYSGETSGNFLSLVSEATGATKTESDSEQYYDLFGIRYAQYIRSEASFVYQRRVGDRGVIASRLLAGGGYAYGNTYSMPFERMFYSGGAYSMRGWQVRSLGPGATPEDDDETYPNNVGDLRLEANVEGRFPISGILHGALFMDVGNIWSNGKGETNDYARFKFDTFYKQLAVNTGLGARFDFSFFVLRVDWGIQLRNPGWEEGHMWINKFDFSNTALHFAIGYPF